MTGPSRQPAQNQCLKSTLESVSAAKSAGSKSKAARQYLVRSTGRYPLTLPISAAADRKRKTRKAAAGTATKKVEAKSGGAKEENGAETGTR